MTKARKCCCTPEPYRHLFYLALYLERVGWIHTQFGSHLYSDPKQDFSSKLERYCECKAGALFRRSGRLGHTAICCALAAHPHQTCSGTYAHREPSHPSRFPAGLGGIPGIRKCQKDPDCFLSSYRFSSFSFSRLKPETTPFLSSIMPYNGLIPVTFGRSELMTCKGLIPLVAARIVSSTAPSRGWRS